MPPAAPAWAELLPEINFHRRQYMHPITQFPKNCFFIRQLIPDNGPLFQQRYPIISGENAARSARSALNKPTVILRQYPQRETIVYMPVRRSRFPYHRMYREFLCHRIHNLVQVLPLAIDKNVIDREK